jgi:hypothetical protein
MSGCGSSGDSLEWMAGGEVSVSAIGDGKRNIWCHQWTHEVSLVRRLWDSEHGSTRNR